MRALCGAIIAAGACVGLGLATLGIGTRYQDVIQFEPEGNKAIRFFQMDHPLAFSVVFLTAMAVIGLGIAFVGLAYHHHRRHHEHLWELERRGLGSRPSTSTTAGTP